MVPNFLIRSIIAGLIAALISSFIGVYVVLRKMSFFTHAISHASLTGIAIGYLVHFNPFASALVFGSLTGLIIGYTMEKTKLYIDTVIGVFLPASLSIGLIIISLMKGYRPDLMSYLFGDILSVTIKDILLMSIISVLSFGVFLKFLNEFTILSIDEEWAKVKGINIKALNYIFLIILSLIIIIGAKVVGIILVSALIIMPPASAVNVARSFKETVLLSVVFSISSMILGTSASYLLDLPSGPFIIVVLSIIFLITFFRRRKK